jgi:hypothetical protein
MKCGGKVDILLTLASGRRNMVLDRWEVSKKEKIKTEVRNYPF